jgi:hypothetical protein
LRLPAAARDARRATARVTVTGRAEGGGTSRSVIRRVVLAR